jgi:hypothetical protein
VQKGVEAFQREWARYTLTLPGKLPSLSGSQDLLRPLLLRQLVAPTETEAALLGSWRHDENQGSGRTHEIADVELANRLRYLAPDQLRRLPMSELYWPIGLAARTDASYAELFAAASAGELGWEALAAPVETGPFVVRVAQGVDVDPDCEIEILPTRTRFGLSALTGTLVAPAIQELAFLPATRPCVMRLDFLTVVCHVQGVAEPVVVRLESPGDFARLRRMNCFVVNPNVFVVHGDAPELRLDLRDDIPGTIFRVDVQCGFAVLGISQLLPTPGRLRSVEEAGVLVERLEHHLAELKGSISWRITRPLRALKRVFRS